MNHKILIIVLFGILSFGCNSDEGDLSPIRKNTTPEILVKALRKDSLFKEFNGYSITPRDERSNIYLVSRNKEFRIYHWIKNTSNGAQYLQFHKTYKDDKNNIVKQLTPYDSLEILNKAHQLIDILKKLNLRWVNGEFGKFDCSFNDSTRMIYVQNKNKLDSTFYKFHKNLRWIDSNFVTYE